MLHEYRWIEDCPHYDVPYEFHEYSDWLTDNVGPRVWNVIGDKQQQQYKRELDKWCTEFPILQGTKDTELMRMFAKHTILMQEGQGWQIIGAVWIPNNSYKHIASFYVSVPSDADLVNFKLVCL
jgi:hypothetical protein